MECLLKISVLKYSGKVFVDRGGSSGPCTADFVRHLLNCVAGTENWETRRTELRARDMKNMKQELTGITLYFALKWLVVTFTLRSHELQLCHVGLLNP
jgi:hypothetical protein